MFYMFYALAKCMIGFETSLATLPMETNVAFCAHTSCIFFCTLYDYLALLQGRGSVLPHRSVHQSKLFYRSYNFFPVWKFFLPS